MKDNFPKNFNLKGIKIVLDCANGASYKAAPYLLRAWSKSNKTIGIEPNGLNINYKRGSMFPSKIKHAVKKHKANIGISFLMETPIEL